MGEEGRKRRTAYSSGRKEVIGAILNPFKAKRKVGKKRLKKPEPVLGRTPFRSNFRWKQG